MINCISGFCMLRGCFCMLIEILICNYMFWVEQIGGFFKTWLTCARLSIILCLFPILFLKRFINVCLRACLSLVDLVIYFKRENHHLGLIHSEDYTVYRIKAEALKITGVYRLNEIGKILLNVMNPKNKMLYSNFRLKFLFGIHNWMGLNTFEVEFVPILCRQCAEASFNTINNV